MGEEFDLIVELGEVVNIGVLIDWDSFIYFSLYSLTCLLDYFLLEF